MSTTTTKVISAQPCGHDRRGQDLAPREYEITRDPEPFNPEPGTLQYEEWDGRDRYRLWGKSWSDARHGLDRETPLAVVFADTIVEVP